ncbi:MAG: acyl-CoA thioesterase [Opitutae bacterium]|nr:acyl-CoA thioesterase [Opitutae bacterium]
MVTACKEIRVRYAETDMMGVTYHANYFVWFETARIHLLKTLGISYKELEKKGYLLPVIECHAQFHKPVTFDDLIVVNTLMESNPGIRFRIDYQITCDGQKTTTGYTTHVFMDEKGQVTRPPKTFLDAVEAHPDGPSTN